MLSIFIITFLLGFIVIFMSIKNMLVIKRLNRYMEIVDLVIPSMKKSNQWRLTYFLKSSFYNYFNSIYDREIGIRTKGLMICLGMVVLIYLGNYLFLQLPGIIALTVGIFTGGYVAKRIDLREKRLEFEKAFPQALIIINGAISSGGNIIQALQDCSKSIDGVLSKEFEIITRSLSIGDDPANIFANSYSRMPFQSYYFFLIALLVSMKSGAKLKEILSRLSSATTKAKTMEKKKLAMTSEARMSAKITAAIPFAFLILMKFISPDNFDYILHDPNGRYVLYYFLTSELIGMAMIMFFMRKL